MTSYIFFPPHNCLVSPCLRGKVGQGVGSVAFTLNNLGCLCQFMATGDKDMDCLIRTVLDSVKVGFEHH